MRVRVLGAEIRYSAAFARPAYEVVGRWLDLCASIHAGFAPLGGRTDDIRWEKTGEQPQDFSVAWINPRDEIVVRYRLSSIEMWTRDRRFILGDHPGAGVVVPALAVARSIVPDLELQSQTAIFQVHGQLDDLTTADILRKVVQGDEWARPEAVKFRIPASDDIEATADLQRSLVYLDARNIWGALTLVMPGAMPAEEACERTTKFVNEILARVGVDLDWGA